MNSKSKLSTKFQSILYTAWFDQILQQYCIHSSWRTLHILWQNNTENQWLLIWIYIKLFYEKNVYAIKKRKQYIDAYYRIKGYSALKKHELWTHVWPLVNDLDLSDFRTSHSPVTTPVPDDATPLRLCASQEKELVLFKPVEEKNIMVEKTRPPKKTCVGLCFNFRIFFVDLNMHSFGELKRADLKRATSAFRKTQKTHTHTAHADIHRNMSNEGSLSHTQHSSHFLWK